ncbi:MAG TPA: hypothetical protein VGC32_07575 [Solirubrobacterales bacterium]
MAGALAALVAVVAIFSIWANRQLLDTDSWVTASGKALESSVIRRRVEDFIAGEVVDLAGGATRGRAAIPPALSTRLRDQAKTLSDQVLTSAQFRVVWQRANRIGHRAIVGVLEERGRSHGEGRVAIDLTPAVRDAVGELGGADLAALVKPHSAEIEVLEAHQLETTREVVRIVRDLPIPAALVALLLWALTLFLGRARRWRALAGVGLSLVLAGVLALIVRAMAGHEIVDRLLSHDADRGAAEAAWRIATSLVVDVSVAAIGLGALLISCAALLGSKEPAPAIRGRLGSSVDAPGTCLATLLVLVSAFIGLSLWAPIAALESPLGIALFAVAVGSGAFAVGWRVRLEARTRSSRP